MTMNSHVGRRVRTSKAASNIWCREFFPLSAAAVLRKVPPLLIEKQQEATMLKLSSERLTILFRGSAASDKQGLEDGTCCLRETPRVDQIDTGTVATVAKSKDIVGSINWEGRGWLGLVMQEMGEGRM
ncbi:hypothetical protein LIA77_10735 [Sarocladium implicatum]|nr:hypothetical protein LIA77_10735 [Sarocladium implicatum]